MQVRLFNDDQILRISYFTAKDEGLYAVTAKNKVDSITRRYELSLLLLQGKKLLLCLLFSGKDQTHSLFFPGRQIVVLASSLAKDAVYANISLPVIIAVVIAVILVILLIVIAKICYDAKWRSKRHHFKEPPNLPTPRLTQYELPQDQEEDFDDCR